MTNEQHNRYLSWAFVAHGAFQMLMGLFVIAMFSIFIFAPTQPGAPQPPKGFFVFFGVFMFLIYGFFALPGFIAAYGLRKKKKWARMASIVAGIISAMNVPIGTATCVYSLWFFLGENWKEVYPEVAFANQDKSKALQLQHERETRWTGYKTDEKGEVTFNPVDPPDWR